jgi:hypothetical protein
MDNKKFADEHRIFEFLSGSHAYGTQRPGSDKDYRGVFITPFEKSLSSNAPEQLDSFDGEDRVMYSLKKFFKLATTNNPNIIEFFFIPSDSIIYSSHLWDRIRNKRDIFVSQKCVHTFMGYGFEQLKRIERHRGYLLDPPDHKPTREEYDLPEQTVIPGDQLSALLSIKDEFLSTEYKTIARREKAYDQAKRKWDSYKNWEKNRNADRKKLEAVAGYDTKHAMHLIRLMLMANELVSTGKCNVRRPDADYLLDIRKGKYDYETISALAKSLEEKCLKVKETSVLPYSPNHKAIEELQLEILKECYDVSIR